MYPDQLVAPFSEHGNHKPNVRRVVDLKPGDILRDGRIIDHVRFFSQRFARVYFTDGRPQSFLAYEDIHLA